MSRTSVVAHARSQGGSPMCSHSAPPLIMRLHSAVSWPKSEARTEGEMIARGIAAGYCGTSLVSSAVGAAVLSVREEGTARRRSHSPQPGTPTRPSPPRPRCHDIRDTPPRDRRSGASQLVAVSSMTPPSGLASGTIPTDEPPYGGPPRIYKQLAIMIVLLSLLHIPYSSRSPRVFR